MTAEWLRIDEKENAIDSLEMTARLILELKATNLSRLWKWISISLFNALYGFCICAIQGTNPDRVKERDCKTGGFKDKLIGFEEAFNRIQQDEWMKQYTGSKTLSPTGDQKISIRKLKDEIRNNFEHFTPKGWSIEISGMPKIVLDVVDIIEFLALVSGNPTWDCDAHQEPRIQKAIAIIRSL
jgi:hypothetical protein